MIQRNSTIKDKLGETLGVVGFILYYLITGFITVLPFVMIDVSWYVTLILIVAYVFIPAIIPLVPIGLGLWIWGFVCAISGPQDFLAILYYIVFAVKCIPLAITMIETLIAKK